MDYLEGIKYAIDVSKGNVLVCKNVRLACQRFLNYLEDKQWQYEFHSDRVEHVLRFIALIKHTKGPEAGKTLNLEPFQILLICAIYGFRHKKNHDKRMTTDVILYIPRKSGKSTLIAAISLYELRFSEAGAEVFTLATNREQATIVFDAAKGMIESMPKAGSMNYRVSKYEINLSDDSQTMFWVPSQ